MLEVGEGLGVGRLLFLDLEVGKGGNRGNRRLYFGTACSSSSRSGTAKLSLRSFCLLCRLQKLAQQRQGLHLDRRGVQDRLLGLLLPLGVDFGGTGHVGNLLGLGGIPGLGQE
jgi:hypothetical protein